MCGAAPAEAALRARSPLRRGGEVAGFVFAWMGLGWLLRLDPNGYLLLGVPLTLAFQRWVRGRPLRSLWVREGPPLRLDGPFFALAGVLLVLPVHGLATLPRGPGSWVPAAWYLSAMAGAVAAAYALRRFRRETVRSLLLCLASAGAVGVLLVVLAYLSRAAPPAPGADAWLTAARWLLLYFAVSFVLEEVTFRGALDAHVHPPGARGGLASALLVAALWGLWHLPIVAPTPDHLLPVQAATLVATHVLIGVPLALCWRRSGNLAVVAFTHALINAVRNVLLG